MGDSKRFRVVADFIIRNFKPCRVADIAGGKGHIQQYLRPAGFTVVTFDKRKGRKDRVKMEYKYGYFDSNTPGDFGLLLGIHPDEATDVIIAEASRRGIPFVIVPCCVKPTMTHYIGDYHGWLQHLTKFAQQRGFCVSKQELKMQGCNIALIGR